MLDTIIVALTVLSASSAVIVMLTVMLSIIVDLGVSSRTADTLAEVTGLCMGLFIGCALLAAALSFIQQAINFIN